MLLIILLALLALWGIVVTIVNMCGDGGRPVPTDWTRVAEYGADECSPSQSDAG